MNFKTFVIALAIAGAGYHFWSQHKQHAVQGSADANGFFALPAADGVDPNTVLILAAPNCPKAGARRAAALAQELAERDIPYTQSGHVHFSFSPAHASDIQRLNSVMSGPTPIVLIHGRGKSNPTLDEVAAEYNNEN